MKLLVVLITYNRLDYTKRTLKSLLDTITVPHYIVAVDNNSTDGTQLWLADQKKAGKIDYLICNEQNEFPGKATNLGWSVGISKFPEATHLMRLDNDFDLYPGWDTEAITYFDRIKTLGQLGLDYEVMEDPKSDGWELTLGGKTISTFPGNVGGTNIITRLVWDKGLRYDETPWSHDGGEHPSAQEDVKFSLAIKNAGFLMGHMTEEYARTFATRELWKEYPDYYRETMKARGYDKQLKEAGL